MNGLPTISRRRCTQEASASVVLHCRPGVEAESICQFLPGPLCLDSKQEEGLDLDLESSELYIVGSWSGWTKMERMERKGSGRWVSIRRQAVFQSSRPFCLGILLTSLRPLRGTSDSG